MGRRRTHAPMAALALGVVLAFATVSTASGGQRSTTKGDHATSPAGLLAVSGELSGIAATHGVAWAVGYSGTRENSKALTLYWNGHRWQREANPSPPGAELFGVAATSPTDFWAVGSIGVSPNPTKTLILHRTGKKWEETPSIPGSLSAVAATSPTNAWAVGSTSDGAALVLHWNGKEWRQTPSPAGYLSGVAATSPTNAWAVGGTTGGSQDTLILHWNGEAWQQTPSPSVGGDQGLGSVLLGVEASPDRPVLAVGDGNNCGCGPGTPLVERWNGHTWGEDSTSQPGQHRPLRGGRPPDGQGVGSRTGRLGRRPDERRDPGVEWLRMDKRARSGSRIPGRRALRCRRDISFQRLGRRMGEPGHCRERERCGTR